MLRQSNTTLGFDTRGRGLVEITRPVADWATAIEAVKAIAEREAIASILSFPSFFILLSYS